MTDEILAHDLGPDLAADLVEMHDRTAIDLLAWDTARAFVEAHGFTVHHESDDCAAEHYRDRHGVLRCGGSFMAGTICDRAPGHDGPHAQG